MTATLERPKNELTHVDLAELVESSWNYRKTHDKTADEELALSVARRGVLEPLLLRPLAKPKGAARFEIVSGGRRYRAIKRALELLEGKAVEDAVDASVLRLVPASIRDMSDAEAREIQIVENVQRRDVHPVEEAEGLQTLVDEHGYDVPAISRMIGKSEGYVRGRLKLAGIDKSLRAACLKGEIALNIATLIARVVPKALQREALERAVRDTEFGYGVNQIRDDVLEHARSMRDAPWKLDDAELVPEAGACSKCPKRSQNDKQLFEECNKTDFCDDGDCWAKKVAAHGTRLIAAAKKKGGQVLEGKKAQAALKNENLIAADEVVDFNNKGEPLTAGQLARKAGGEQVLAVVDGKVTALVSCDAVTEGKPKKNKATDARQRAANKKESRKRRIHARAVELAIEQSEQAITELGGLHKLPADAADAFWTLLVDEFWADLKRAAAKRRGLHKTAAGDMRSGHGIGEALEAWFKKAEPLQRQACIVELLVFKHVTMGGGHKPRIDRVLSGLGVSLAKCETAAAKEIDAPKTKAEPSEAPKAAKKTVRKKAAKK